MASPDKAHRHDLISGATGTGKTITLQTLAEGFSNLGMPVFLADIKGDLTGLSQAGAPKITQERGLLSPAFSAFPTTLWDVFGVQGHPLRAWSATLGLCCCAHPQAQRHPVWRVARGFTVGIVKNRDHLCLGVVVIGAGAQ